MFLFSLTHFSAIGWADSDDSLWPEPVYFPQRSEKPVTIPLLPTDQKPTEKKSGKHLWPFGGKDDASKRPPPSVEQIIQVGAKDPAVSPYPLLRLPSPIETGQGIVPAGIYLLKPAYASPSAQTVAANNEGRRELILSQRNRDVLQFYVHTKASADPNLAKEGTPSPLSKTDPQKATPFRAEARISLDRKSLIIQLRGENQTFESESFPVATDQRHILTY